MGQQTTLKCFFSNSYNSLVSILLFVCTRTWSGSPGDWSPSSAQHYPQKTSFKLLTSFRTNAVS